MKFEANTNRFQAKMSCRCGTMFQRNSKTKICDEDDFYQEDEDKMKIDEGRAFDNGKKVSGWPMLALS